ncbi:MAG: Asp23/Gls24 family envelope stress response protein [Lachnospiraceae bacterium]|nr:Asp23/Gls24 family envelope stress response protein [Lachnospiraceae bacterium]
MSKENERAETYVLAKTGTGVVKIADDVVSVIAALAAQEVEGVAAMVGGIGKRIIGYVGHKSADTGVRVDVDKGRVNAYIAINIKYGYSIPEVSKMVQEKVKAGIETMTGFTVESVNIRVEKIQIESTPSS